MRAFGTTIVMAVIAAIACGVAYYYYPKITVAASDDRVGENLLSGEDQYQTKDVRTIKIQRFDNQRNAIDKIQLSLVSGSWVIPTKFNFLAGNAQRVSQAISSIRDKKILEMVSDQQDDHEEFGVVEPNSNLSGRPSGVGTLISLSDRGQQELASVIIGLPTTDRTKRFVRIPGQPQIYVIDFDDSILTTQFADWVDGDLLRFGNQQWNLTNEMSSIDIDYYFVDPSSLQTTPNKKSVYRCSISYEDGKWIYDLWLADSSGALSEEATINGAEASFETLRVFVGQLRIFSLRDVKKKPTAVAQQLAEPKDGAVAQEFSALTIDGFRRVGFENGQHQFDSIAGVIRVEFITGMEVKIYVGNIAGLDIANRGDISRYMLILAGVNESLLPMPAKPGESTEQGSDEDSQAKDAEKQDPQDDTTKQREYQKLINERNAKLEKARQTARALNQLHADWIYVVPESTIESLFPDEEAWKATASAETDVNSG